MQIPIQSVKFWLNAFIPKNIAGYTRNVPGKPGLTMIPGPQRPIILPRGTPLLGEVRLDISDCYHTDQRGFDSFINASSRMHSEFKIDFTTPVPTMTQWHNCDFTTECDCEDGDEECHKKGAISRMGFRLRSIVTPPALPSRPNPGPVRTNQIAGAPRVGFAIVEMDCHASNPCAPTSRYFGDIDITGLITIDVASRSIEFDGLIDAFPAFEAYATINDGKGVALFREAPPQGNTVMNLPGDANRPIRRFIKDRDGDGVFE